MSTTDRPAQSETALAEGLRNAGFVRLVVAPDGDSVAASGLVARALAESETPYQLSVTPHTEHTERSTDADLTVAIGRSATEADLTIGLDSASAGTAHAAAREFGVDDLALALAGTVARDGHPGDELSTLAAEQGVERRPGVGIPTTEIPDGLAHSTLVHAPFSGDPDAASAAIDGVGDDRRKLASQVALAVAGDPEGTPRGAERVERLLRPLAGGPFETIAGYADVLDAVSREQPGLAVALAVGSGDHEQALASWRRHASAAHEAVRQARTSRYDGLFVARCDGQPPVGTAARLLAEFRSPESLVLVVGEGVAAAYAVEQNAVGTTTEQVATAVGGSGGGTTTVGRATFDNDPTEFVAAFKEAV